MACDTKAVILIQQGEAPSTQGLPPADLITAQQERHYKDRATQGGPLRALPGTGTDGSAASHGV